MTLGVHRLGTDAQRGVSEQAYRTAVAYREGACGSHVGEGGTSSSSSCV